MDSTLRSNISVGLPLDLLVYDTGALRVTHFASIDEHNEYFRMIRGTWGERLRQVFAESPTRCGPTPSRPTPGARQPRAPAQAGRPHGRAAGKLPGAAGAGRGAGVGSVELETAHVRLYAIPGCPTLRPTHVNFTCPPSEARMQAIAAGFRVSGANAGRPAEPGRLRSAMKSRHAPAFFMYRLPERSTRQLAPDRHRRLGVVERIEMHARRAVVQQGLAQLGHHVHAEGADRGLVVAELGQAQTDPAALRRRTFPRSAAAASGW